MELNNSFFKYKALKLKKLFMKVRELKHAPVAQLDRVGGFEPLGREFESLRVRHNSLILMLFLDKIF